MAQYGHNWYGTAYYGKTNAFSGWYQTHEIFTDEALKDTVSMRIRAVLPAAFYGPKDAEIQQLSGEWSETGGTLSTSSADAELMAAASADHIEIHYQQRTIAAKVNVKVTTVEVGEDPVTQTHVLNTQGQTVDANAVFVIPDLPFGDHQINITMAEDSPEDAPFRFKGINARTSHMTVESRAKHTAAHQFQDSEYKKMKQVAITHISGDEYLVEFESEPYVGSTYVQFKVYLASSDNATTPEAKYLEIIAGNTDNRTEDGRWSAIFNMNEIAREAGVSFASVEEVDWESEVPETTELTFRSKSATRNITSEWNLEKETVPYRKDTNRLRLKEGHNSGWVDTPLIAPETLRPFIRNVRWTEWDDISFLPPDSQGTSVVYDFLSSQKDNAGNPYIRMTNPMQIANRKFAGTQIGNRNTYIRIHLRRSALKQTPVVDHIDMDSLMHYEQDIIVEDQEFSAVNYDNTGHGVVLDMTEAGFRNQFKVPQETSNPDYDLIDNTQRPQDVILYFSSEGAEAIRTNRTTTLNNKVIAETKDWNGTTGLRKHYQYGGGEVNFPSVNAIEIASAFTPSLVHQKKYRYHLDAGWPDESHTVYPGDTLDDLAETYGTTIQEINRLNSIKYSADNTLMVGQSIRMPNESVNDDVDLVWRETEAHWTDKSAHNAELLGETDTSSDAIEASVKESSTYGWVDWVSEEKIFDGVINPNDIRREYRRRHTIPEWGANDESLHTVMDGETFTQIGRIYGVDPIDIKKRNNVMDMELPEIGAVLRIPPRITLPAIIPEALVEENPYEVEVVYRSVKKEDGTYIPEEMIQILPLSVGYREVERQSVTMTRGQISNGHDVIPDPRVKRIISIESADGMRRYNPYNSTLDIGDFILNGNSVDWSPGGTEPARGTEYVISYIAEIPETISLHIDTTYREEGGVDRIWRSPEVKMFEGLCAPGEDHVLELPEFDSYEGLPDNNIEDISYVIEDNDLWVKTWVEERDGKMVAIGSLQDRVPRDNWLPRMKTGYYYLGKDEYYLYSEPILHTPTEREMPKMENVIFGPGKFKDAAILQDASENAVRNSGFEHASEMSTVFSIKFE